MSKGRERLDLELDEISTSWTIDLGDSIQSSCNETNIYHDGLWEGYLLTQDAQALAEWFKSKIEKTISKMQEKGYRKLSLEWKCSKFKVEEK